jgi:hypothetical protein
VGSRAGSLVLAAPLPGCRAGTHVDAYQSRIHAAAGQARRRVVTGADWGPSTLDGPRILNVGGRRFRIPRSAQVKVSKRSATTWVRTEDGLTHVLSESGMLIQSDAEKASTPWSLL